MRFPSPLIPGRLIRRYKRFLADIDVDGLGVVTAHCPNPGRMMGFDAPGLRVWVEPAKSGGWQSCLAATGRASTPPFRTGW
jgi:DNA-binding sugar fermentation-stimulating protein